MARAEKSTAERKFSVLFVSFVSVLWSFFHFPSSLLLVLSLASDLRLRAARMAADGASNNVSVDLDDLV